MGHWIDYNLLISEIHMHRENAQRIIKSYKEEYKNFPLDLMMSNDMVAVSEYREAVGQEIALCVLEGWCNDFKFTGEEVKEMEK